MLHGPHVITNVLEVLLAVHGDGSAGPISVPAARPRAAIVMVAHVVAAVVSEPHAAASGRHLGETIAVIRTRWVLGREIRIRMVVGIHCYGRGQFDAVAP